MRNITTAAVATTKLVELDESELDLVAGGLSISTQSISTLIQSIGRDLTLTSEEAAKLAPIAFGFANGNPAALVSWTLALLRGAGVRL